MDPIYTLRMIRYVSKKADEVRNTIMQVEDQGELDSLRLELLAYLEQLLGYVDALDGWLSRGGFLPEAWWPSIAGTGHHLIKVSEQMKDHLDTGLSLESWKDT